MKFVKRTNSFVSSVHWIISAGQSALFCFQFQKEWNAMRNEEDRTWSLRKDTIPCDPCTAQCQIIIQHNEISIGFKVQSSLLFINAQDLSWFQWCCFNGLYNWTTWKLNIYSRTFIFIFYSIWDLVLIPTRRSFEYPYAFIHWSDASAKSICISNYRTTLFNFNSHLPNMMFAIF